MEAAGVVGGGGAVVTDADSPSANAISEWSHGVLQRYQHLLDKSTPHVLRRWMGFTAVVFIYIVRVYLVEGFYIVSYGLGIYILNLLIAFLSPQVDPEIQQDLSEGPILPSLASDEFRPFVRRLPEFKFWYCITRAFCVAFVMTFFSVFDVPVFWPILLLYWVVLFTLTMNQISAAREVDVRGGKKAIVIFVPVPQLKAFRKVQQRLTRELEKKFSDRHVVFVAQRRMLRKPTRTSRVKQKRPRSRTLTNVHERILEDLVFPTEIVGKRTRVATDGTKLLKVFLDAKDATSLEYKLDSFASVYRRLTGKDVSFEFPVDTQE